jgi:hypothetical protein
LHELGDEDDRFTKEEIQSGHSKVSLVPGKDQLLVTGQGGPSGSGKKPAGETVLPPPVFIQETTSAPPPKPGNISRSQSSSLPIPSGNIAAEESESKAVTVHQSAPDLLLSGTERPRSVSPTRAVQRESSQPNSVTLVSPREEAKTLAASTLPVVELAAAVTTTTTVVSFAEVSANPKAFNGVTWNAVFPVPASSLSVSVWALVDKEVDGNLAQNPFRKSTLSFSELLDFTLPPVDSLVPRTTPQLRSGASLGQASLMQPQGPSGITGTGFNALRQMLPSVNLSFGGRQQAHE